MSTDNTSEIAILDEQSLIPVKCVGCGMSPSAERLGNSYGFQCEGCNTVNIKGDGGNSRLPGDFITRNRYGEFNITGIKPGTVAHISPIDTQGNYDKYLISVLDGLNETPAAMVVVDRTNPENQFIMTPENPKIVNGMAKSEFLYELVSIKAGGQNEREIISKSPISNHQSNIDIIGNQTLNQKIPKLPSEEIAGFMKKMNSEVCTVWPLVDPHTGINILTHGDTGVMIR